jgi:hypothetical protein
MRAALRTGCIHTARRRLRAAAAAALCVLLVASCWLGPGLHGVFNQSSYEFVTIEVRDSVLPLRLTGSVEITGGNLRVVLSPPQGPNAYEKTFSAGITNIDETFMSPAAGTWTLSAESLTGTGRYDLRIGT